jgi:hypothetical protein
MMLGVASSDPSLAADVSTLSPADAAAMVAAAAAALRGQKDLQWMLPLLSGGGASNNRSDQQAGSSSSDRSNAQAQQQQHRKRQLSEAGDSTAVPHDPAAQRHLQKQSLAALSPAALLAAAGAVCGQGSNKKPRHQAPLGNGGPPAAKTRCGHVIDADVYAVLLAPPLPPIAPLLQPLPLAAESGWLLLQVHLGP